MVQQAPKSILRNTSFGKPKNDDESTISMFLPPFLKGCPPPRRSGPVKVTSFEEPLETRGLDDKINMSLSFDGKDDISAVVTFDDQRVAPPSPSEDQKLQEQLDDESVESGGFIGFLGEQFNSGVDHLKKGVNDLKIPEKMHEMTEKAKDMLATPAPESDMDYDYDDLSVESGGFIGFLGEQFTSAFNHVKNGFSEKSTSEKSVNQGTKDKMTENNDDNKVKDSSDANTVLLDEYAEKLNELIFLTKEVQEQKKAKKVSKHLKEIKMIRAALEKSKDEDIPIGEKVKERMAKSIELVNKALEKQKKLDEDFYRRLTHAKHSSEYFPAKPELDASDKLVLPPPLRAGMKLEYDSAYEVERMKGLEVVEYDDISVGEPITLQRPGLRKSPPKVSFVTRAFDAFSGVKQPRPRTGKNAIEKAWEEIIELAEDLQYTFELGNEEDSVASSHASTAVGSRRSRMSARSARKNKAAASE